MRAASLASPIISSIAATRLCEQFKALQAIDPDDLAAHYNLAILYRRDGMKKQASDEAALYTIKRIDPGAPTYSLDYLRKHPEISTRACRGTCIPTWRTNPESPADNHKHEDGHSLNRRKFIRSLSRTALVLPFADIWLWPHPGSSRPAA